MEKFEEMKKDIEAILEEVEENITDFSLDQIKGIKSKVEQLESSILKRRDKKKVKTFTVSEEVHSQVKKFCVENDIKMCEWIESKLLEHINPKAK